MNKGVTLIEYLICMIIIGLLVAIIVPQIITYVSKTQDGATLAPVTKEGNPAGIITKFELQRKFVDLGYNIKIDGKIGPETLEAWDKQICKQEGIRSMK